MKRLSILSFLMLVSVAAQAKPTIPPEIISCRESGGGITFSIHAVSRQSDKAVGVLSLPDESANVDVVRLACIRTDEGTGFGDQIIHHYSCGNPRNAESLRVEVVSGGLIGRLRAKVYDEGLVVASMIPCKEVAN